MFVTFFSVLLLLSSYRRHTFTSLLYSWRRQKPPLRVLGNEWMNECENAKIYGFYFHVVHHHPQFLQKKKKRNKVFLGKLLNNNMKTYFLNKTLKVRVSPNGVLNAVWPPTAGNIIFISFLIEMRTWMTTPPVDDNNINIEKRWGQLSTRQGVNWPLCRIFMIPPIRWHFFLSVLSYPDETQTLEKRKKTPSSLQPDVWLWVNVPFDSILK